MGAYNPMVHSSVKIREMLAIACRDGGWKSVDNAYRIRRFIVLRYLGSFFTNFPPATVEAMLNYLILEGYLFSENEDGKYYVRIPFDTH